jgi:hypothetical protein
MTGSEDVLLCFGPDHSAADARAALEAGGWTLVGKGDWSWAYASPDEAIVARVTPWDRAYRLHAETCLAHTNRYLQRIDRIDDLRDGGHVVFMERLWPADWARTEAFCAAIGLGNQSEETTTIAPAVDVAAFADDAELAALRRIVGEACAIGAANIAFWGGLDIQPNNVMADADDGLKLIDPLFVAGKTIVAAILAGERERLAAIPRGSLAAFLTIPVFEDRAEGLRRALIEMDLIDG